MGIHSIWMRLNGDGCREQVHAYINAFKHMGATNKRDWNVEIEQYLTQTLPLQQIFMINLNKQNTGEDNEKETIKDDGEVFVIYNKPERLMKTVPSFTSIMKSSLKMYSLKSVWSIRGVCVRLGDFDIKIGQIYMKTKSVGCILDMDYVPCADLSAMHDITVLLEEFRRDFISKFNIPLSSYSERMGSVASVDINDDWHMISMPSYEKWHLQDSDGIMTSSHMAIDYYNVFKQYLGKN